MREVEIKLTIKKITHPKYENMGAFLVTDGYKQVWLPKSQINWEEPADAGDTTTFIIPEWLAEDKELI